MKKTNLSASGTSYYGVDIRTTVNDLIRVIGEPTYESNDGEDKTNFDWNCITNEGHIVTIYDWKQYRPIGLDENINFHIGGMSFEQTVTAKNELLSMLNMK